MSKLVIVGTPIGNLGDISPRAVKALEKCNFIAAEDTRVTLKLLNHLGIKKPMTSYFEHNRFEKGEEIIARIAAGESCALVCDAGMPGISDPGEDLVRLCRQKGIKVEVVPGPTAFVAALSLSGMPSARFCFEGFLSTNKRKRREHIDSLKTERRTMVFYEAPHKLPYTLKDLYEAFGEREIAIVREISKIHEETVIGSLSQASQRYKDENIRGEIVLIVEGDSSPPEPEVSLEDMVCEAEKLMAQGLSLNEAAKSVAKNTAIKKGEIYKALVEKKER
ncbi:MAG: 16S rRNA (cytidine(1402)-2'-O)-methyltransferase [Clostridiales bacterium]|nr:16S rRNA (cytidine(1402)-2'-O)-methyltransferase [Clostridiales bacterium]